MTNEKPMISQLRTTASPSKRSTDADFYVRFQLLFVDRTLPDRPLLPPQDWHNDAKFCAHGAVRPLR